MIIAGGRFHLYRSSTDTDRAFVSERRDFYSSLRWHEEILMQATEVSPTSEYVALHLRTTDRSFEAPTNRAIASALASMRSQTGIESLFIAADTPEGRDLWSVKARSLGFEPWSVQTTDFSRVTLSGGRSAALDWLLLSRANALTFAAASTFSHEAAAAAGCVTWPLQATSIRKFLRRARSHLNNVVTYPSRRFMS